MPQCLSCSQMAPEQAVNCPSCGQPLRSPCPICHELILLQAIKCKFCKTVLQEGPKMNPEDLAKLRKQVAELTAAADGRPDTRGQPGKIGVGTMVVTILLAGSLLGSIAGGTMGKDGEPLMVIGGFFAFLFFLIWLGYLIVDLSIPGARGRATGYKAVKCYLKAVKFRRWKTAFACLSPMARAKRDIEVPHIPDLNDPGRVASFSTVSGLADYWKNFVHAQGFGTARRIVRLQIEPRDSVDPNIERYHVSMKVEFYPAWIWLLIFVALLVAVIVYMVMRKYHQFEFDVVTYKHKSQWWMLTGEVNSPLDRDMS